MTDQTPAVRGDADAAVRRYDYDEESVLIADFGDADGSVDMVDGTVIVVVDGEQYEFEAPADASRAIMNNGVVTIEMEDTR